MARRFAVAALFSALCLSVAVPLLAAPAAAEDFEVHLEPNQAIEIGWIAVPAGAEVSWGTVNGTGSVLWRVEARPEGEVAGGEGLVAAGCARAADATEVRVVLVNEARYAIRDADLVVRVVVQNATGNCPAVAQMAEQRRALGAGIDSGDVFLLVIATAAGASALLWIVSFSRQVKRLKKEKPPPDEGRETLADAIRRRP